MKAKLLLVLLLHTFFLKAQTDLQLGSHFMKDTTQNVLITLRGNYFFASDAITNGFAADYFQAKFLTHEKKDHVSKNLSTYNMFAGEANWEASLTFHPDTSNRKVEGFIAFRNSLYSGAQFSKDFFEIFFRGNKMFAGKIADLSDFSFQQFTYRQFVFGIGNEFAISKTSRLYVGADLAINQGIKFLKVDVRNASIYTHPDGEYLDADLHATIFTDDSSAQHPSKLDGTGYSGDFYIEYETEKSTLSFSVENYGSIHWNKWSTTVNVDSSFRFEGIDVRDLFDLKDSIRVSGANLDSMFYDNFIDDRKEERVVTRLPMKVSGSYTFFMKDRKLSATIGMDVLLHTPAANRYFAGMSYKFGRSNLIRAVAGTGGYTGFHGGLSYAHVFPWHFRLELGSNYIYPMITYKEGQSQGAYLSLSKSF